MGCQGGEFYNKQAFKEVFENNQDQNVFSTQ